MFLKYEIGKLELKSVLLGISKFVQNSIGGYLRAYHKSFGHSGGREASSFCQPFLAFSILQRSLEAHRSINHNQNPLRSQQMPEMVTVVMHAFHALP
jgi:hypothetical protein